MADQPSRPPLPRPRDGYWTTQWRGRTGEDGTRPTYTKRFGPVAETAQSPKMTKSQAIEAYDQWLIKWRSDPAIHDPKAAPKVMTVAHLAHHYQAYANQTYRKRGRVTTYTYAVRSALEALGTFMDHGTSLQDLPASELTPPKLAAVRDAMADQNPPLSRETINQRIGIIRQAWRWAAEKGMIPADVALALDVVGNVKKGRTKAKEPGRVEPVSRHWVDLTLPQVSPVIAAMIEFQWHTGCRPDEACSLRMQDVDRSSTVWLYMPPEHKTVHLELHKQRVIAIGPKAQAVVEPWITMDLTAYLWSPRESHRWYRDQAASKGVKRRDRQAANPRKTGRRMGDRFSSASYRRAIHRACDVVFPVPDHITSPDDIAQWRKQHRWSPNQLRHAALGRIRDEHGDRAAQIIGGHTNPRTTERYGAAHTAEARQAIEIARQTG